MASKKPKEGMTISIPINIHPNGEDSPIEFVGVIEKINDDGALSVKGRVLKTMTIIVPTTTHFKIVETADA